MIRKRKVDRPLRRDVGYLGSLLGEVLIEQAGKALYDLEEEVRLLAIGRRRGPQAERPLAGEALSALLENLSIEEAEQIIPMKERVVDRKYDPLPFWRRRRRVEERSDSRV